MGQLNPMMHKGGITASSARLLEGFDDVSNTLAAALAANDAGRTGRYELKTILAKIAADQQVMSQASGATQAISEDALEQLGNGTAVIDSTLGEIEELIAIMPELMERIAGFSKAMEVVQKAANKIAELADATDILSLNARIEAAVSGSSGDNFQTVASEVQALSVKAKAAASGINRTVNALASETKTMSERVSTGADACSDVSHSIGQIKQTIQDVCVSLVEVDSAQSRIGDVSHHMSENLAKSTKAIDAGDGRLGNHGREITAAAERIVSLKERTEDLQRFVKQVEAPQT